MEWAPSGASCILIGQMAASLLAHGALESWRSQRLGVLLTPPTDPSQCIAPQPPAGAASGQEPARGLGFRIYLSPSFNLLPALEGGGALGTAPGLAPSLSASALSEVQKLQAGMWEQLRKASWCPSLDWGWDRPTAAQALPSALQLTSEPEARPGWWLPQAPIPPTPEERAGLAGCPSWGLFLCGGGTLFSRPWLLLGTPCPQRQALLSPLKPVGTCVPECSLAVVSGLRTRTQASLKVMGGPGTRTLAVSPGPAWTC